MGKTRRKLEAKYLAWKRLYAYEIFWIFITTCR